MLVDKVVVSTGFGSPWEEVLVSAASGVGNVVGGDTGKHHNL